ncbi:MAG: GHKL domain-containing protein [Oscillospiraceae bacterium]
MVTAKVLTWILSDMIMVFSAMGLISSFGVSKIENRKRWFIASAASLVLVVIFSGSERFVSLIGYSLMFIAAFITAFSKIKLSYVYIVLMSEFITSILSSCICAVVCGSDPWAYLDFRDTALLSARLVLLIAVLILSRSERVRRMHLIIKIIPKHIFILTVMAVMFIALLAENNNLIAEGAVKQTMNALLIVMLTVSLVAIIFSLLISVVSKKQVADTNAMLTEMVDAQLRHYERLEKLNNDIRSFRHDYINHVRGISSLLETKQYEDAREYAEKLIETSPMQNSLFQTGNNLADAVLTDKNDLCGESAKIVFYGYIPDKLDNADLCVILSNALDNAAEACKSCEGQCEIEVCAQKRQGYFVLTVRNPTSDSRTYDTIPGTCKEDALNHGFGLRNIEAVVKKNGGHFSVKCENFVFELSLTFKL